MSGFLAIASREAIDERLVSKMERRATYRGRPRRWTEDGVVLVGYEDREGSVLAVEAAGALVCDSRIDNRKEIEAALGSDAPPPEGSDASVLLRVWRRWGMEGFQRVTGDFAAAIWDRRKRQLLVVRDQVGVRPALIARSPRRLLAASELQILLEDPELGLTIDDKWVAAYLASGGGFNEAVGYREVQRVMPGHMAGSQGDRWTQRVWFTWRPKRVRERSLAQYGEGFRELFDESVRRRLSGVDRAGISLSGGLDSTSVAVTAAVVAPNVELHGLAIGFEDQLGDERKLQEAAAIRSNAKLTWVPLEGRHPFGESPVATLRLLGTPPFPPNWFHVEAVADVGAAQGIQVALDGVDGDAVVQGDRSFLSDLLVTGRWGAVARELAAIQRVHGFRKRRMLREFGIRPLIPTSIALLGRRMRGRPQVPSYVDSGFARRMNLARALHHGGDWRPGRAFLQAEMVVVSGRIHPATYEIMDHQWARRGIGVAHPFMDRRVIEYCLGLPWHAKHHDGFTKVVLREAMRGRLPEEIRTRPGKADLSAPFRSGLAGPQIGMLRDALSLLAPSDPLPWADSGAVEEFVRQAESGIATFEAFRVAWLAEWRAWLRREKSLEERHLPTKPGPIS